MERCHGREFAGASVGPLLRDPIAVSDSGEFQQTLGAELPRAAGRDAEHGGEEASMLLVKSFVVLGRSLALRQLANRFQLFAETALGV